MLRLLLAMVLAPMSLLAQLRIRGQVNDQSGGALAACQVALLDANRKILLKTETNAVGRFSLQPRRPGQYHIQAEAPGFDKASVAVTLGRASLTDIVLVLPVAKTEFQLSVQENPLAISTQADQNADALRLTSDDLDELPSLNQDYLGTAAILLGATGEPSVVVDGVERDTVNLPPSTIAEIKINRNPYSAEFSRPGRNRLEITTRSGSQEFRGAAALFLRNSAFDARNAFAAQRLPFSRRGADLSLSGPLSRKRKLGFFIAYENDNGNRARPILAVLPSGLLQADALLGSRETELSLRLDGQLSTKQSVSLRWNVGQDHDDNQGVGGINLLERAQDSQSREHELSLSWTRIGSPKALNQLQAEVNWESQETTSRTQAFAVIVHGAFSSGGAQADVFHHERRLRVQDIFSYSAGRHSVRMGGGGRTAWMTSEDRTNFGGSFEFASLSDFEAGRALYYRQNEGDPRLRFTQNEAFGFVQEEWRATPTLNVSVGGRVELQRRFQPTLNAAPRVGLAWSPGNRKTVLRAGFGLFYDRLPASLRERSLRFDGMRFRSLIIASPSYPDFLNSPESSISLPPSVYRLDPDLRAPYAMISGIALEQQLSGKVVLALDYRLERGLHLYRSLNLNAPQPGTGLRAQPAFGNINQYESSASSKEQSVSLSLRGRWKLGNFSAQYRYLRAFGDTEGPGFLPVNNFDLRPEWGRSVQDRRHRLQFVTSAKLPGSFRLGLISSLNSGAPFNVTTGTDNNLDTVVNDRPAATRRNSKQGPGFAKLDVRLGREWTLPKVNGRKLRLETVAEAFNVLNRVNLGNYVGNLTSPFFGRSTSALDARQMQVSLRFQF